MIQRKKNIRLLIILTFLTVVTVAIGFFDSSGDRLSVDRKLFALKETATIDKVIFQRGKERNELSFKGAKWHINDKHLADKQRVSVLFAVLKQNRVRRKVANRSKPKVDSLFTYSSSSVSFYSGSTVAKTYQIAGEPDSFITYMRTAEETFIVEIPGYRTYLADLYQLDESGWRDPLVFNMNWANLQKMSMVYPERSDEQFDIVFDNHFYAIRQLNETDSAKLMSFMDDVSLLFVNDYLSAQELTQYEEQLSHVQAGVVITDVGENTHSVEFFGEVPKSKEIVGRIDSSEYVLFDYQKVRKLLKPKIYFVPKRDF